MPILDAPAPQTGGLLGALFGGLQAQQPQQQQQPFYNPPPDNFFGQLSAALFRSANAPGTPAWNAMQHQQQMQMTYEALQKAGLPEPLARLGTIHPEALGGLAQGYFQPPASQNYINPQSGTAGSARFDPRSGQYVDFATGQPLSQTQPNYAQSAASPYTAGAPPPGVDISRYRQDEAQRIAEEQAKLRDMGSGAIDFLPDALRTLTKIKNGDYNDAIGPIEGSDYYNMARGIVAGPAAAVGITGPQQNLSAYNQYKADIQRLSSRGLKAAFGAKPTNTEVDMNKQTFGGMQTADAPTAANILSERIRGAYESLGRSVDAGLISPNAVPRDIAAQGVQMGALNPSSFGMYPARTAPQPTPQPQNTPQPVGQATAPPSSRVGTAQPQAVGGQGGPATAGAAARSWTDPKTGKAYQVINGKLYQ